MSFLYTPPFKPIFLFGYEDIKLPIYQKIVWRETYDHSGEMQLTNNETYTWHNASNDYNEKKCNHIQYPCRQEASFPLTDLLPWKYRRNVTCRGSHGAQVPGWVNIWRESLTMCDTRPTMSSVSATDISHPHLPRQHDFNTSASPSFSILTENETSI